MWKIRLPRDQDIIVTKEEAEWVKDRLQSSSDPIIEISGQVIRRNQILAIISEEHEDVRNRELAQERAVAIQEWKEEQGRLSLQTPEEKAERELKCKIPIIWFIRSPNLMIPDATREQIKARLIEFFNQNPKEAWGTKDIYGDLLPGRMLSGKREGFQSVKEIIKGRIEI